MGGLAAGMPRDDGVRGDGGPRALEHPMPDQSPASDTTPDTLSDSALYPKQRLCRPSAPTTPLEPPAPVTHVPSAPPVPQTRPPSEELAQAGAVPPTNARGLGRYQVFGEIGHSGMERCYMAAIPTSTASWPSRGSWRPIRDGPKSSSASSKSADRQAVAASRRRPVYEVGRSPDQTPYFTMKLVQGRDPGGLARRARVARGTCRASRRSSSRWRRR
jgi:hypothetical protein